MKQMILFILALGFLVSVNAHGQSTKPSPSKLSEGDVKTQKDAPATSGCSIPCCQQSFPYDFCNPDGVTITTKCSTNPSGGADGTPVKSFIPGCVNIENSMPDSETMQPNATPPKPESYLGDDYFISKYPATDSFYMSAYDGSWDQQIIDSERFIKNEPPQDPKDDPKDYPYTTDPGPEPSCCPTCGTDQYGGDSCQDWENIKGWYYYYLGAEDQYAADQEAWAANQAAYTTVWNQTQAASDAQTALTNWLNSCQPPITPSDPSCCLNVLLDSDARHFDGDANVLAVTPLPECGETTCAEMQARVLRVNISAVFLNTNRQPDHAFPPSQYTLHTVHFTGWYTDPNKAPNLVDSYSAVSFFQLMEHEIGHILGLEHPEGDPPATCYYTCLNCYTANPVFTPSGTPDYSGFHTVMAVGMNVPANSSLIAPLTLTSEDQCQFQKLYCNPCGSSGVIEQKTESEPSPEIFPNPTTGTSELDYAVKDRAFVQVAIYDMLGNMARPVSSNYEEIGLYKISLGTESLPAGQYVCRVRVGETVTYLNVVIER